MTFGQAVLIVEDDDELRGVLARGLREEGFAVDAVATGSDALERVERAVPDVLVIDIGLPDTDGRDLCQALRARGIQTPVLFLTARDALVDRIAGFDAGGDDYLAKPFAFVELVARLQALLRRSGGEGALEAAGLRLDPVTHSVGADGRRGAADADRVPPPRPAAGAGPGEAVRRRDLVRAGWPHGAIVRENTLDALRRAAAPQARRARRRARDRARSTASATASQ